MAPYRTTEDDLLRALRERARDLREPDDANPEPCPSASEAEIAAAEADLGFLLPPLLRRVYEVVNGSIGPGNGLFPIGEGEDTLVTVYRTVVDSTYASKPGEPGFDQFPWPERLLPICDWGCAIWSCLDCRSEDGPVVTASNGEPFANTGHSLRSWLEAWLAGAELFQEMFEPGPTRRGINPFTRQPIVIKGTGKPKGAKWS